MISASNDVQPSQMVFLNSWTGAREPEFERKLVGGRSRTDGVPRH